MVKKTRGYTLVELLVVSAIVAFILSLGASLMIKMNQFFRVSIAKIETQRDLRNDMNLLIREIRQAKSTSVVLSRENASQPPYSKISFANIAGESMVFWQAGRDLNMSKNGQTTTFAKNLHSLIFSYPMTDDPKLISVLLSMEKSAGSKGTYALQVGGESIRLLND